MDKWFARLYEIVVNRKINCENSDVAESGRGSAFQLRYFARLLEASSNLERTF